MGIEMEPADISSPEQQKPFWDSTQPPEDVTEPQPEVQSVSPPQAQVVGNLGQQQSTHFYATVNNPAQYSSASSITTGYDMTEKKTGMNWKQFAIGFFAPIVIMILLTILSEVADGGAGYDRWDDVHRMEMIAMSSDNGTFTHTFSEEVTDYGRFEVNWCNSMNWEDEYEYHCDWGYNPGTSDKDIFEVKNNGRESGVVVGEYTQHNRTIWFTTESHSIDEIEFEFEFKDRELEMELDEEYMGDGVAGMFDTFFCLMPLAGIVAIVISFARGNKSLGYGLIAAASIPTVLSGLMFMLFLMLGFY
jgi:hypothetical protein